MVKVSNKVLLLAAALITVGAFAVYVLIQQSFRYAANQPQESMAQDAANALKRGGSPHALVSGQSIDMSSSAAPFIIIYDQFGKVVAGNGYLGSVTPQVPIGVLTAGQKEAHAVTWQPAGKVRIASVSIGAGSYYVLSGRSLKDTESTISRIGNAIILIWLVLMIMLLLVWRLARPKREPGVN